MKKPNFPIPAKPSHGGREWGRNRILDFFYRLNHPIVVFVILQLVIVCITIIWVIWYQKTTFRLADSSYDLLFLILGCVSFVVILFGTISLFVFAIKQSLQLQQQSSFVSSVTHELRSPLASIQLAMDTLERKEINEDQKAKIRGMMRTEAERLGSLVEQILVSARLDHGIQMFKDIGTRRLETLVDDFFRPNDPERMLHKNRIIIREGACRELHGPINAIQLILTNLLENAIKYSPASKPIEVSLVPASDCAHFLKKKQTRSGGIVLVIKDYGMGVARRDRKKIFRKFYRSSSSMDKAISGTGLGLYIVKKVCSYLNAPYGVESKGAGQGSLFYILLQRDYLWEDPKQKVSL